MDIKYETNELIKPGGEWGCTEWGLFSIYWFIDSILNIFIFKQVQKSVKRSFLNTAPMLGLSSWYEEEIWISSCNSHHHHPAAQQFKQCYVAVCNRKLGAVCQDLHRYLHPHVTSENPTPRRTVVGGFRPGLMHYGDAVIMTALTMLWWSWVSSLAKGSIVIISFSSAAGFSGKIGGEETRLR